MFLSKRPNGVYHLFYTRADGKRSWISTKTKLKSEANKFLVSLLQIWLIMATTKSFQLQLKVLRMSS